MAEYITEFFGSSSGGSYTERRERIVRCRDCESWCGPCEIRPDGIEGVCDGWSATGNVVLTREDDFCSYGKRATE